MVYNCFISSLIASRVTSCCILSKQEIINRFSLFSFQSAASFLIYFGLLTQMPLFKYLFTLFALCLPIVLSTRPTACPVDWWNKEQKQNQHTHAYRNTPCNAYLFRGHGWVSYPTNPAQMEIDYRYLVRFVHFWLFFFSFFGGFPHFCVTAISRMWQNTGICL